MKKIAALALAIALFPAVSSAEGLAVSGKVGTLGLGLELTKGYADNFSSRLGFNTFSYTANYTQTTVNYDMKLQLQTLTALADWYPMRGAFRASGGLFYNNNKFTMNAVGATPAGLTSLRSEVTFNKVAPYLGIGWGNPAAKGKGWGLTSDLGILFQGSPKVSMTGTGPNAAAAQAALDAERVKLQDALKNFKFYPVASIGISYQW